MSVSKATEILHRIIETWLGSAVKDADRLMGQIKDSSWSQKLSAVIHDELDVEIAADEIESRRY